MGEDYPFDVGEMPGSYSVDDVRDWYGNVEAVLEFGEPGSDQEMAALYRRIEKAFDTHNELARSGDYAEAFYELERAAELVDSWDVVDAGLEKGWDDL